MPQNFLKFCISFSSDREISKLSRISKLMHLVLKVDSMCLIEPYVMY